MLRETCVPELKDSIHFVRTTSEKVKIDKNTIEFFFFLMKGT